MVKPPTNPVDVSVVVTAHNEGILAHKTMLSIFRSAKKLEKNKISYEIIVHIDNGTDETDNYFKKYENDSRIVILRNSFGDLSSSRNYAVNNSRGRYVTFIDADDLYSEEWLLGGFRVVSSQEEVVARMNYILTFCDHSVLTELRDMSKDEMLLYLIDSNYLSSVFMCSRDLYQRFPQRKNQSPYGFEDWQWVLDTMSAGVIHQVVPETVLFYRKDSLSKPSYLTQQSVARRTLSPTKLLGYEEVRKIMITTEQQPEAPDLSDTEEHTGAIDQKMYEPLKFILYKTLVHLNRYKLYRRLRGRDDISEEPEQIEVAEEPQLALPEWLIDEWKSINKIEKTTFPSNYIIRDTELWMPNKKVGIDFVRFNQSLDQKPDTLFFVPWLVRGGGDKVFINTANELNSGKYNWNIAFIQTLPGESTTADRLDKGVDFVDIADTMGDIDYESRINLMAMFIAQNNIKRIVIGNSRFGYDLLLRYRHLIKSMGVKVYTFAFSETIELTGRVGDYIHECIPFVDDIIYRIVSDNTRTINQMTEEHAISETKLFINHQYVDNRFNKPRIRQGDGVFKLLWAGRVCMQKTPEVLRAISEILPDNTAIDVYGDLEEGYTADYFGLKNITYIRGFKGIDDLPTKEYDAYLYTSSSDGMPNMLLEVAAKGLPIIAPDVGGIRDFIINDETGILVSDYSSPELFIQAINKLKDSPDLRLRLASRAQSRLKESYSKDNWKKEIENIYG